MQAKPLLAATTFIVLTLQAALPADEHPLSVEQRAAFAAQFLQTIEKETAAIVREPKGIGHYSQRGDAFFFSGEFDKAVADYEKMVELDRDEEAQHWRRGIAYFYAGRHKDAAHQFEIYHSFDDVDRENGIWRYLSQVKAIGRDEARKGLLKYKKDDREPFPDVYKLFAGEMTSDEILARIEAAKIDDDEREKRRFYAELYVGLNFAVEDQKDLAIEHLRKAVANTWGPSAGFGPNYMWHVGRLHYELLTRSAETGR